MINKIKPNVFQLHFEKFGSCVYVLRIKSKIVLIDTSTRGNKDELLENLRELGILPEDINFILITHRHYDHIENLDIFPNAEIRTDIPELGIVRIETPGHSSDSVCYLYDQILFSGDTLFHNGIGRTDFDDSNPELMIDSLKKIEELNYDILCPGHIN